MRDEDEIQEMADSASSAININPALGGTVNHKGHVYDLDYLRGVRDALDWALDEDSDDAPIE